MIDMWIEKKDLIKDKKYNGRYAIAMMFIGENLSLIKGIFVQKNGKVYIQTESNLVRIDLDLAEFWIDCTKDELRDFLSRGSHDRVSNQFVQENINNFYYKTKDWAEKLLAEDPTLRGVAAELEMLLRREKMFLELEEEICPKKNS